MFVACPCGSSCSVEEATRAGHGVWHCPRPPRSLNHSPVVDGSSGVLLTRFNRWSVSPFTQTVDMNCVAVGDHGTSPCGPELSLGAPWSVALPSQRFGHERRTEESCEC